MYQVSHFIAKIKSEDYVANYRDVAKFISYCKECNRYQACWSCPPFDFDVEAYISSYEIVYIIGTKILLDPGLILENKGWEQSTEISYRIMEEVRLELDGKLLDLEKQYPGSKAFFAGTCQICPAEKCARIAGKSCIAPDRIRPSLEAFGFDIAKTSAELLNIELKWNREGILPEYFTLISGFFASKEITFTL